MNRKAQPFREVQLKNIFGENSNPIPVDFRLLNSMISGAYSGGIQHILTLISFVLLLCSVYGITNFFDWRLLNTIMLYIITASIIIWNSFYFAAEFEAVRNRVNNFGMFKALGGIVNEPFLFITNIFFALVLITMGTIKFAVRKHAQRIK